MGLGGTGGVTISESITEVTNKLDFEGWQEFAIESCVCAHANTHIHAGREWMSKRRVTANTYMEGPGIPVGIRPKGPALSPLVIPVWQGSSLRIIWLPTWCIWRTSLSLQPGANINEQCRHWWDLQYQVAILLQFLSIFPSLQSCHFIPSPYYSNSSFISKRCPSFYFKKTMQWEMSWFITTESTFYLYTSYSFLLSNLLSMASPMTTHTFLQILKGPISWWFLPSFPTFMPSTLLFPLTSSKKLVSFTRGKFLPQLHLFFQLNILSFSKTKFELFAHFY